MSGCRISHLYVADGDEVDPAFAGDEVVVVYEDGGDFGNGDWISHTICIGKEMADQQLLAVLIDDVQ